jgi:Mg-chelatase subunit ChlD
MKTPGSRFAVSISFLCLVLCLVGAFVASTHADHIGGHLSIYHPHANQTDLLVAQGTPGEPYLWDIGASGEDIDVLIIDTGASTHPAFNATCLQDMDGTTNCPDGSNNNSNNGHGTAIAGIIGASGASNVSLIGMAPRATISMIKLDLDAGSTQPINFANLPAITVPAAVDIIALSTSVPSDAGICNRINAFITDGKIVVAAAGNQGLNLNSANSFPAKCPNSDPKFIVVAATGNTDVPWGNPPQASCVTNFNCTNYGTDIDLYAPGQTIYSATKTGGYNGNYSGTSFAAPMVAGAAAQLLTCGVPADAVKTHLQNGSAVSITQPAGGSKQRLDVKGALRNFIETTFGAIAVSQMFNPALPGLPILPDNTPGNTPIATLSTNDQGAGTNCNVMTYTIPADPVFNLVGDELRLKPSVTLTPGPLSVTVTATDAYGRTGTLLVALTVTGGDTTPPVVNVDAPVVANIANSAAYPLSGACTAGDGNVNVTIGSATPTNQAVACSGGGTWNASSDVSAVADGAATISISASQTDAASNTGSDTANAAKDTVAPAVNINTPAVANSGNSAAYAVAGSCSAGQGNVTVAISDATPPSQAVACSGGAWNAVFNVTGVIDGSNAIAITASQTDAAGNPGTGNATSDKDSVAPVVTINTPPDATPLNEAAYPLSGTCSNGDGNVTVAISGATPPGQAIACGSGIWNASFNVAAIPDGTTAIDITVLQTDAAGNSDSANATALKDATAPTVSINSPVVANIANAASYAISGSCAVSDGNVTAAIAGATPANQGIACAAGVWSATFNVSSIGDGTAVIAIIASQTDSVGNTSSDNASADKDTVAPAAGINGSAVANIANAASYTISGGCTTGDGDISISVTGAVPSGQNAGCVANSWSVAFDVSAIADGSNVIAIAALQTDAAGNPDSANASASKDTVAPAVGINAPATANPLTELNYGIAGTCSNGDGNVTVAISGATPSSQGVACAAGVWAAVFNVSAIADGANALSIQATQTDIAGNTSTANAAADKLTTTPNDVVLVMDRSGSMNLPSAVTGTRLQALKAAANLFIDRIAMDETHRLGLIQFSSSIQAFSPPYTFGPLDASNVTAAHNAINGMTASGATNILEGVQQGVNAFTAPPGLRRTMVLFTDGMHNTPGVLSDAALQTGLQTRLDAIVPANPDLEFYSIGLGTGISDVALTATAAANDGWHANEVDSLMLAKDFAMVAAAMMDDVVLLDPVFTLSPGEVESLKVPVSGADKDLTVIVHWDSYNADLIQTAVIPPGRDCAITPKQNSGPVKQAAGINYRIINITLPFRCNNRLKHTGDWTVITKMQKKDGREPGGRREERRDEHRDERDRRQPSERVDVLAYASSDIRLDNVIELKRSDLRFSPVLLDSGNNGLKQPKFTAFILPPLPSSKDSTAEDKLGTDKPTAEHPRPRLIEREPTRIELRIDERSGKASGSFRPRQQGLYQVRMVAEAIDKSGQVVRREQTSSFYYAGSRFPSGLMMLLMMLMIPMCVIAVILRRR